MRADRSVKIRIIRCIRGSFFYLRKASDELHHIACRDVRWEVAADLRGCSRKRVEAYIHSAHFRAPPRLHFSNPPTGIA